MKLKLNERYLSGMIANTDLHAGGIFFCIIYQNCLQFFENGKVELTKSNIDDFRPMDDNDVQHLKKYKVVGTYSLNERGYLVCQFKELAWTFTGLPTEKDSNVLSFHIYDSRRSDTWSEVYKLEGY